MSKRPATVIDLDTINSKLLLTTGEAAWLLNISQSFLGELMQRLDPSTGKPMLHSVKLGRRRMVAREALQRFIDGLSS